MTRFSRFAAVASLAMVTAAFASSVWRPVETFGVGSLRFWADDGVALALVLVSGVALLGAWRRSTVLLACCVAVPAGGLLGAALASAVLFPTSRLQGPLVLGGGLWLLTSRRFVLATPLALVGVASGLGLGALHFISRRPPEPKTRPTGIQLEAEVDHLDRLEFPCGTASLEVQPLLAFQSTSRDGLWPGASPPDELQGEPPLEGDARRASLRHTERSVEATTLVPHAVATHVSRYAELLLVGAAQPRLRFDALGRTFDFLPYDFPQGLPAHFAFVRGKELVVARGASAEKGPFTTLTRGPLGEELALTFFDGERALCTVRFLDFVAQADVENLSPTAGEGVTPNVVRFGIPTTGEPVPRVHLSLAETDIGAGLEMVRVAAGVYRTRIELSAPQ